MDKLQSEKLRHFPNVNSLLKISLGLVLFTIISSALVYAETGSVNIEGNSFDVEYTATGMSVSGIDSDLDSISLIFSVDVTGSTGALDVSFDRSFFDSIFEGADDDFFILVDGDFADFTETETNSQSRTLSIEIPSGTQDVEIIGSVFGDSTPDTVDETPDTVDETPDTVDETPDTVDETPKTQCGPGTILQNGSCVLDERCGPGTVLIDGACVIESTPQVSETTVTGDGMELIIGSIAAFGVAGGIGIALALISKSHKNKN